MLRKIIAIKLFILPLVFSSGCSHLWEQRVITQFAKSLETHNIAMIQKRSSDELNEKALRDPEALEELKFLKIPTGKVKILKVEEISDNEKKVVVEVGEKKTKLQYILIKNEDKKWVVDNILFRKELKGLTSSKSLIDQMTFLLTMRETVDAWESGNRKNIIELCTPELKTELDQLPPAYLAKTGKQLFGEPEKKKTQPKGQLDEDIAIVQLKRKNGALVITLKRKNDEWRVDDISLNARKKHQHLSSLKKNAIVVNRAQRFLNAYKKQDREELEKLSASSFYRGSLKFADLSAYPLPVLDTADQNFEVVISDKTADLIIYGSSEITKVRLKKDTEQSERITTPKYTVKEVVLYELGNNKEEKKLSGMFTAQAVMKVFHDAWKNQDLGMLKKSSTKDLNRHVWKSMNQQILPSLQLPEFPTEPPEVLNISFRGPIIEITASHGDRTVSYILKEHAGAVHVDDILLPVDNRPQSFKESISILKPVYQMALGLQTNELPKIRNTVTNNFNRSAWSQISNVPDVCNSIPLLLQAPVLSITTETGYKIVELGFNNKAEIKVTLEYTQSRYFIDNIEFTDSHQENSQTVNLKAKLKELLASGNIKFETSSKVVPAEFLIEEQSEESPSLIDPLANVIPVSELNEEVSLPVPSDDAFETPAE